MAYRQAPPPARDLLYTNAYIACMIGTRVAPGYFTHLLHLNERDIQLVAMNGAFYLIHPAVPNAHPITYINNRPAWLLDYMVRDVGTVVPQPLWSPASTADAQRYGTTPLHMPIFFVQREGTIGLSLNQAASGNCPTLVNARQPAPVGDQSTTTIRIMWPGQHEWHKQIMIRDQTTAHNTISTEALAGRVARTICRFLQERARQNALPGWWIDGQGGITDRDIILVGLIHVTQGSWQPVLQLNRFVISQTSNMRR